MLIQFNFKNFKSFKGEASLDLTATRAMEFRERITSVSGVKLLPTAAIYGANASGKSNVYNAFEYMTDYVVNSFKYGGEHEKFVKSRPSPFKFSKESAGGDTSFEVYFTIPGDSSERSYNYGFSIGVDGITEEWLGSKARTSRKYSVEFYRDSSTLELNGFPQKSRENIATALEKQTLIISLGAKLRIEKCKLIRDWFLSNEFADFGNPVMAFFLQRTLPNGFVTDDSVRKKVVEYISSFDDSIKDFKVEKLPVELSDNDGDRYKITALHSVLDSDEYAEIPLEEESAGTLKMFALYPKLQNVLDTGSVFFIDELNARLHPLLVRNFILSFLNPSINKNHAQLVFTSHDTWQLSRKLLRRDEIWFTSKDEHEVSSLYSLDEFQEEGKAIRKDSNYEKNYLHGRYGAIPVLGSLYTTKEK